MSLTIQDVVRFQKEQRPVDHSEICPDCQTARVCPCCRRRWHDWTPNYHWPYWHWQHVVTCGGATPMTVGCGVSPLTVGMTNLPASC